MDNELVMALAKHLSYFYKYPPICETDKDHDQIAWYNYLKAWIALYNKERSLK